MKLQSHWRLSASIGGEKEQGRRMKAGGPLSSIRVYLRLILVLGFLRWVLVTVHRSPRLIGNYHLSATGHASRYEIANEIIRIMKEVSGMPGGWASIKPITSDQYPLPAKRPGHPVTSTEKIKRVFGVEMPHWEIELRTCLQELAGTAGWHRRA
ncbi:MAG: sugar nucleotide-binding protein [Burkholderiales bacterium]